MSLELDELLALIAAPIYAADPDSKTGLYAMAAERAIGQAEMLWKAVVNRKSRDAIVYGYHPE
jgi:hypothetical protein